MTAETPRPEVLVVVAGTGTEIGKTWVAAELAGELRRRGHTVQARKPAQSFEPAEAEAHRTDADQLAAATREDPTRVCPPQHWYPVPLAPPMAAEALGRAPVLVRDLAAAVLWSGAVELGLVETAGGVRSPQAVDGDVPELIRVLEPDLVLLVADAALGTINLVRLASAALGPTPLLVVLNRFDDEDEVHCRNLEWLRTRDGFTVVTSPEAAAEHICHSL